jgi:hypothetical protein
MAEAKVLGQGTIGPAKSGQNVASGPGPDDPMYQAAFEAAEKKQSEPLVRLIKMLHRGLRLREPAP